MKNKEQNNTGIIKPNSKIQIHIFHSNNAITLVSLVITIVILLILSGVAISVTVNQEGLFGKVNSAASKWNDAVTEEQVDINNLIEILNPAIDSVDISNNATLYYGAIVENYNVAYDYSTNENIWRIFYADGEDVAAEDRHIYLISDDYIHYDCVPETENYKIFRHTDYKLAFDIIINDYKGSIDILNNSSISKWLSKYLNYGENATSRNVNIKAVAYMLDTSIWNKFKNDYADYAIGGPTLEMFCASYKDTHPNKYIECKVEDTLGYKVKWSDNSSYDRYISELQDDFNSIYIKSDETKTNAMWLSSPSTVSAASMMSAYYTGHVKNDGCSNAYIGFRPIIALKYNIQLKEQENGNYIIIE